MEVTGQYHALAAALPTEKVLAHPLYRRLVRHQIQCADGGDEKNLCPFQN
jgi:hypothetical protein